MDRDDLYGLASLASHLVAQVPDQVPRGTDAGDEQPLHEDDPNPWCRRIQVNYHQSGRNMGVFTVIRLAF